MSQTENAKKILEEIQEKSKVEFPNYLNYQKKTYKFDGLNLKKTDYDNSFRKNFKVLESSVDYASYKPTVSDVHNFEAGAGTSNNVPLYDFPDGKDTGERMYALRRLGLDITELEAIKKSLESEKSKMMKETKEKVSDLLEEMKLETMLNQGASSTDTPNEK